MTSTARATTILLAVNLAVYVVVLAGWLLQPFVPGLAETMVGRLSLPGSVTELAAAPWTPLTYMFTHVSFIHLTVNMLWLFGFGAMMKGGWKNTVGVYLAGGLCGALAFLGYTTVSGLPGEHLAGASAAAIAVVLASAILSPERRVKLLLFGDVPLKWVVPVALLTICAGMSAETAAHAGGILAGIAGGITLRLHDRAVVRRGMKEARRRTMKMKIIHKVSASGFASLSEDERRQLFDLSDSRRTSF